MKVAIIDTETTGLVEPQACEIAMIELPEDIQEFRNSNVEDFFDDEGFISVFEQRYRPTKPIDARASAVTGIYMKDVIGCPSIKTFEFPSSVEFFVAHNALYDWKVLNRPEVKRICTMELSRLLLTGASSPANHKLTTVASHIYGSKVTHIIENAHGALADCRLTFLILRHLVDKVPVKSWDCLVKLCSQGESGKKPSGSQGQDAPLQSLPFGKHKGVPIKDVPTDYLLWLNGKSDVSGRVKKLVEEELAVRL